MKFEKLILECLWKNKDLGGAIWRPMERREQGHALLHIKKSYKSLRITTMRRWFRDKQILKGWPKYFLVVQSLGCVWLFDTPWTVVRRASLSFTTSRSPPKFMSIVSVIQPSHPLHPLLVLPSVFPSIRVFSNESVLCIGWPKLWKFTPDDQTTGASASPSVLPMSMQSLISLKIDWFDLLAVQGTLQSLLQHQFEGINSLVLCLLCGPALTTLLDYYEDHSLDYTDLCWQRNVSGFQQAV